MRLTHIFEMRDGKILREIVFDMGALFSFRFNLQHWECSRRTWDVKARGKGTANPTALLIGILSLPLPANSFC